ncbi:MAG: universal stress protein [Pseudomonadota bacterium]|jgi:nucleotide-binding universal stress UspA family protein
MTPEIKNILFATDLSENAHYAFEYASVIAERFGAAITILHVLEELSPSSSGLIGEIVGKERWAELKKRNEEAVISSIRTRIETYYKTLNQTVSKHPSIVQRIIVKTGHPADQIIRCADKTDCDIIVMGSRGQGMLAEVMLGSTSHRVLRRCGKPVLVVRLPGDE